MFDPWLIAEYERLYGEGSFARLTKRIVLGTVAGTAMLIAAIELAWV